MASSGSENLRSEGGDLEMGYTEALRRHVTRHVVERPPVSQRRLGFEHRRPRFLQECVAEAIGTFIYV